MSSKRFTRRRLVKTGIAATVAAGVSLEGARGVAAEPQSDLSVGHFVRNTGPRSGVVKLVRGGVVTVALDRGAFIAHGTDGVVDSLETFVPGEEVAVRGAVVGQDIAATEVQSVYTSVSGTLGEEQAGHVLRTSSGTVHVPDTVLQAAQPPAGTGSSCRATIWTHPGTGEATAVDLVGNA